MVICSLSKVTHNAQSFFHEMCKRYGCVGKRYSERSDKSFSQRYFAVCQRYKSTASTATASTAMEKRLSPILKSLVICVYTRSTLARVPVYCTCTTLIYYVVKVCVPFKCLQGGKRSTKTCARRRCIQLGFKARCDVVDGGCVTAASVAGRASRT